MENICLFIPGINYYRWEIPNVSLQTRNEQNISAKLKKVLSECNQSTPKLQGMSDNLTNVSW